MWFYSWKFLIWNWIFLCLSVENMKRCQMAYICKQPRKQKTVDWSPRQRKKKTWNISEIKTSSIYCTNILGKYIVLVLISLLFHLFFFLCCGDQSTGFCMVSFDFNWSRFLKIQHPFALVCRCALADIRRFVCLEGIPPTSHLVPCSPLLLHASEQSLSSCE